MIASRTCRRGFTLIEILIAIVILGMVLAITAQGSKGATAAALDRTARAAVELGVAAAQAEAQRFTADSVYIDVQPAAIRVLRGAVVQPALTQTLPPGYVLRPTQSALVQPDGTLLGSLALTLTAPDGTEYPLTLDRGGVLR